MSSPVSPGKGTILSPSQIGPNPHYSSKFTFTCEGPSKKSVAWPGSDPSTPTSSQSPHTAVPQARSMSGGAPKDGNQVPSQGADKVTGYPPVPPPAANTPPPATSHSGKTLTKATLQTLDQQYPAQPAPPLPSVPAKQHGQESRRQQAREFAAAARARRKKQEAENRRNPPKPDELWICEFCEYESIFGEPPSALIRLYEAKDQRIRAHEAERRRLLEKAKMRGGRKAKKPPKDGKNARRTDPSPAEDAADYAADNGHDDYYAGHADDVLGDLNPEAPSTEAMSRHSSVDNQVLDEFEGEDHPDHPDHLEEAEEEGDYDPLVYDVPNWKQYGVHPDPRHPLTGCCGQLDHGCPLASRPAEGRD